MADENWYGFTVVAVPGVGRAFCLSRGKLSVHERCLSSAALKSRGCQNTFFALQKL